MSALQTDSEREQNDALWLMNGSQSRKPRDHEARATAEASMACQAITEAISFGSLCSRLRMKAGAIIKQREISSARTVYYYLIRF